MITYHDLKHGDYDTLDNDYEADYEDATGVYYSDSRPVQDTHLLQSVSLASLGISVKRLKQELTGLGEILDPRTDKPYPTSLYQSCLEGATTWAEQVLDIVIRPRVEHEIDDYNKTEYMNYMTIRTNERPIIQIDDSRLIFNNNTVLKYPRSWIKANHRFGLFKMQPTALMAQTSGGILQSPTMIFPTMRPNTGMPYGNSNFAPGMIGTTYIAGFLPRDPRDKGITRNWYIPYDLIAMIAKQAAIYVLTYWGRSVLAPGIAGYHVNIDGIGSSVESTQSAQNTGSSGDIRMLEQQIPPLIRALKSYFGYNLGILS